MINIVIADAQYLVRIGLKSLLSTVQDFKVIGEAANTKELLDLIAVIILMSLFLIISASIIFYRKIFSL
jgi:DNA-binding NarL/FixJ family response regulator